ncbi:MAG: transcriptional regulator [Candidatus Hodarchaeales archaeon]|jgi:DNA-binding transcriptional ArsR family regulator
MAKEEKDSDLRFNPNIDKIIHEPSRLIIISYLYISKNADLIFFKRKTNLSWGNLSAHISKLEEAEYIKVEKIFRGKKPSTTLEITSNGIKAFEKYRNFMKIVFSD